MKFLFKEFRVWIVVFALLQSSDLVIAQGQEPMRFDGKTWKALIKSGPRPAAYLFTTSYCSTCPDAFEILNQAAQSSKRKVELAAVMMDVRGAQAKRHASYFPGLTRLYAFDGFETAIRQSVDPQWQDITPYIVLIDQRGQFQRMVGPPEPGALKAWLR